MIKYRADIDGLRSLAVLSVFAFHLGFSGVPGGFVGVDVFFVISGFLIGSSVFDECADGNFSYAKFYERRFRRILPALTVMLAITAIVSSWYMLPSLLVAFGKSLSAAILSVSNIYFWRATDYFGPAADALPLLHTWSLGVEEQFYLLFPPFAVVAWRYFRSRFWQIIALFGILSFLGSVIMAYRFPAAGFYLLPSRGWELLIGFAVLPAVRRGNRSVAMNEATSIVGLLMILGAILLLNENVPFPGIAAVPPCLGTALVIAAGPDTRVGRLLAVGPMRAIGLISYSLYLWHWPLIVFAKQALWVDPTDPLVASGIAGAAFGLSWLSWRFIEQPARRRGTLTRPIVFGARRSRQRRCARFLWFSL